MKRFWDKVDIKGEDDCWEWKATLIGGGYGGLRIDGRLIVAHRVCWMIVNGPIPEGKLILHKCDNRKCVNPRHLYIGTRADNIRDAVTRNRGGFGYTEPRKDHSINTLIHKLAERELVSPFNK